MTLGRNCTLGRGGKRGRHRTGPERICCAAICAQGAPRSQVGSGLPQALLVAEDRSAPDAGLNADATRSLRDPAPQNSAVPHTVTWVPTSTTRPVGIWKKSVASLADFARPMNR